MNLGRAATALEGVCGRQEGSYLAWIYHLYLTIMGSHLVQEEGNMSHSLGCVVDYREDSRPVADSPAIKDLAAACIRSQDLLPSTSDTVHSRYRHCLRRGSVKARCVIWKVPEKTKQGEEKKRDMVQGGKDTRFQTST